MPPSLRIQLFAPRHAIPIQIVARVKKSPISPKQSRQLGWHIGCTGGAPRHLRRARAVPLLESARRSGASLMSQNQNQNDQNQNHNQNHNNQNQNHNRNDQNHNHNNQNQNRNDQNQNRNDQNQN